MKKTIITLAIAFAAVCGLSANAQTPVDRTPGANNKMYQPREFTELAFEGILLDINQQTRIDSLHAAMKANCPEAAKCEKGQKPEGCDKKADKPCDKKCEKHGQKGPKAPKCNPAQNPEYMAKVKEILTPEQYTVFLENIVKMQGRHPQAKRDMRGPRDMHKHHPRNPAVNAQRVECDKQCPKDAKQCPKDVKDTKTKDVKVKDVKAKRDK